MDGKIYIIGVIGQVEEGVRGIELVDVVTQVRNQPDATSFTCYVDSPGGEVEVGEAIYNYLKSLKQPIKTVGSNMVASIATVIFMAGSTRVINEGCEFMIHLPMGGIQHATADEMEAHSKVVRNIENRMIKFYTDVTGLTKEAIKPLLKNETWLTPEQLKSFGFITGDTPLKVTAKAIINTNPKKRKMSKSKKKKTLLGRLEAMLDKLDGKKEPNKALILKSADQTDVDFYELEEGTDISVGDRARIDGQDAEGEVTMADGRVVTFSGGAVESIEDGEEDATEEELAEALKLVKSLKADKKKLKAEVATLKTEAKTTKKTVANIRKIQSQLAKEEKKGKNTGAAKKQKKGKSALANAMAGMKAINNPKKD